jgi:N-acyl-phosphatidylethanolamine-hydrolysing phospholipase D
VTDENRSHVRPGGGYRNPWDGADQLRGFGSVLKWVLIDRMRDRFRGRPSITRAAFAAAHPPAAPSFPTPRAAPDQIVLTWIGHSSFLIQIAGYNILADPVWSEFASPVQFAGPRRWVSAAVPFDALPPIDAVIISHDHYDHLDRPTVERLAQRSPAARWFAPLGVGDWLRARGVTQVDERDWWGSARLGETLALTATPAQHFSGRRADNRDSTLWCGWVLRAGARAVYFVGDTGYQPALADVAARLGPFDAICMPIGAYDPEWFMGPVHTNPEHAVTTFQSLATPTTVMAGMHWGTFKLTDESMDEPPRRTRAAWAAAGLAADRLWIPRHGESRAIG